jgi:hypothetical protein
MSETNPYTPATSVSRPPDAIGKVGVKPVQLYRRAYQMLGDQYWLFVGITLVGMLVANAVPFGILFGPMLVGIFICFLQREAGCRVEFAALFKGFDQFMESLIAWLIIFVVSTVVILFTLLICGVLIVLSLFAAQGANDATAGFAVTLVAVVVYPIIFLVSILIYLPFFFVFQLIADHQVTGVDAVKASIQAARRNFWGTAWYLIATSLLSIVAAMLCFVPAILFLPLSLGGGFLLYREVFVPSPPASGNLRPPPAPVG